MNRLVNTGCKIHDGLNRFIIEYAPYPLNQLPDKTDRKPVWKCVYVGVVIVSMPLLIVLS